MIPTAVQAENHTSHWCPCLLQGRNMQTEASSHPVPNPMEMAGEASMDAEFDPKPAVLADQSHTVAPARPFSGFSLP